MCELIWSSLFCASALLFAKLQIALSQCIRKPIGPEIFLRTAIFCSSVFVPCPMSYLVPSLKGGHGREGAEGRRRVGRRLPQEGPALISSKCILVLY